MAKTSFLQLCSVAARECGATTTDLISVLNNDGVIGQIVGWVAQADLETQSRWNDWDFLHVTGWVTPTEVGNPNVLSPPDLGTWDEESFVLDATTANYKTLASLDYVKWRNTMRNGAKTNQKPSFCVVMPDLSLKLEAPPDAVYTLSADYWKRPTKMVNDGDTSPIPEEYERLIIARAKIYYAEFDSVSEIISSASVEYDDLLDKLEAKYLPSKRGRRMSEGEEIVVRPE
jgi:hypothetical protein